ncbi:MAG: hypothetical protein CL855_02705 [Cryomorphaceae bacterium]|nr:hypothetical protein [Cryomorphaceae bacterium]
MKRFNSFREFYPYYLEEHKLPRTKLFHFIGTLAAILFLIALANTQNPLFILGALLSGYGAAWISHFFVEKNKPATFKYPLYSLLGDYRMFFEILMGRHRIF